MNKLIIAILILLILTLGFVAIKGSMITGNSAKNINNDSKKITLEVSIPCPGHAGLIINELKKINGVEYVEFNFPNKFDVYYDENSIQGDQILNIPVFRAYPAKII